jgi:hypothetical protein
MTFRATIHFDTSRNSRDPHSYYGLGIAPSKFPISELKQIGPVLNNVVAYEGVYETPRDALEALLTYVAIPCRLRQSGEYNGAISLRLCRLDDKFGGPILAENNRGKQRIHPDAIQAGLDLAPL